MALLDTDRELTRDSYYVHSAPAWAPSPPLQGEVDCDVAVVGAGLAGLSAALELASRGLSVTVLEAQHVGFGASGRNGGQAIHGLACDMSVIEAQLGQENARRVFDMSIEALDLMRQRMAAHAIDCEWQDGFLSVATSPRKAQALAGWAQHMAQAYGYPMTVVARDGVRRWIDSPRYHGVVHDPRSGHLHPLKYTQGLARAALAAGVRLFEATPVTALEQGTTVALRTPQGRVRARQVLLAGNVYLQGLAPALAPRIMPVGTYIVCTEPLARDLWASLIPSLSAVCDTDVVLDYFRPTADRRMLYGGRCSYSTATPRDMAGSLRQRMLATFPQLAGARLSHAWGGFVDITMNRAPDFGRLPPTSPGHAANVYYLQGFSGHGLALTGLAGQMVAQAMTGDASRFDVFARLRHRPFPGGALLRMPALVLGMAWYRLRDLLG
jgi:gamma-glutamylputrescine oxidase